MLTLSTFAVRQIFDRYKDADGNAVYVTAVDEGWIIVWPDGENLHTYRHPARWMDEWPWED